MTKCKHGKSQNGYYCKQCKIEGLGGKGICEHQRIRKQCKECGGASICKHQKQRHRCKECGGSSICEHQREKNKCKECDGSSICEHQRIRSRCKDCNGASICEHQRQKIRCKDCGGSSICEHQRERNACKDCGGSYICEHQRIRNKCIICGGASICEHKRIRSRCIDCGGASICEHQRRRDQCNECREALPIGECLTRYKHACVICGKKLTTLKRQLEKTCLEHSQDYNKRPEHYWREQVLKQIKLEPSYIDQPLKSCDKMDTFKPDLCYLTKDIAFALELDEESHSGYEVSCELKKTNNMKDLFPNRKLVMIRVNPHPNPVVPKEYKDMAQRTDYMLDLFTSLLKNPNRYELSDKVTNVFYLFYCQKGLKHIQAAEKCEGVIIQDKFFCVE